MSAFDSLPSASPSSVLESPLSTLPTKTLPTFSSPVDAPTDPLPHIPSDGIPPAAGVSEPPSLVVSGTSPLATTIETGAEGTHAEFHATSVSNDTHLEDIIENSEDTLGPVDTLESNITPVLYTDTHDGHSLNTSSSSFLMPTTTSTEATPPAFSEETVSHTELMDSGDSLKDIQDPPAPIEAASNDSAPISYAGFSSSSGDWETCNESSKVVPPPPTMPMRSSAELNGPSFDQKHFSEQLADTGADSGFVSNSNTSAQNLVLEEGMHRGFGHPSSPRRHDGVSLFGHPSSRLDDRSKRHAAVCQHWLMGKCHRGDACPYSHKSVQLPPTPNHIGSMMPPMNSQKKSTVCSFWKQGKCNKGAECRFLHVDDALDPSLPSHSRLAQGKMLFGPSIMSNSAAGLPPGYRTDLCRFRQSRCPFGADCNDAHTIDELLPGKFTQEELRVLKLGSGGGSSTGVENASKNHRDGPMDMPFSKAEKKDCIFWLQGKCKKGDRCPYIHPGVPPMLGGYPESGRVLPSRGYRIGGSPDRRYMRSVSPPFAHERLSRSPGRYKRLRSGASRSHSRSGSNVRPTPPWAAANRLWRTRKGKGEGVGMLDNRVASANHTPSNDCSKSGSIPPREALLETEVFRDLNPPFRDGRDYYRPRKELPYNAAVNIRRDKGSLEGMENHSGSRFERDADSFSARNHRENIPLHPDRDGPYYDKVEGEADMHFRGKSRYLGNTGSSLVPPKGEKWRY